MVNNKAVQQSHLKVATDLEVLQEVFAWFDQVTSHRFPLKFCQSCKLALVEGFANTVNHAHRNLPKTTVIELELKIFVDRLEMRIWDQGEPFDLPAKLDELHQKGYDFSRETGRGLLFMEQLTDKLSYEHLSDQRNCLFMVKRLVSVSRGA